MKKFVSLLLILVFCFGFTAAQAADYMANALFTITYDDAVYTLDDTSYVEENTEDVKWLFSLSSDKIMVDCNLDTIEGLEQKDFLTASDQQKQDYIDGIYDYFADENPELVAILTTSKESIPFFVFSLEDDEGTYYTADTLMNGAFIGFDVYYAEGNADDALLDELTLLVQSFVSASA